jgi:arylsulfatase A-like enzyme
MSKVKNVVMIMTDSWQFNYTGCYGNDWIKTPNVDALAREGMVFDNAYAEGLPTIPVRRSLATGRYTLPYAGWVNLSPQETSISDICYRNHIQSALIADCPMLHLEKYIYSRGFDYVHFIRGQEGDHFYGNEPLRHVDPMNFHRPVINPDTGAEYPLSQLTLQELKGYLCQRQYWKTDKDQHAARTSRSVVHYLENVLDRSRSFYLWLDFFDPHEPWDPPSVYNPDLKCPYDPDYKGKDIILPVGINLKLRNEKIGYTEEELHHIRMLFAEKTTMTDKYVGVVLNKLKELGLYDNTLIIWLSDHGEPLGHEEHGHGLMRKVRPWPYEELVHIPLVIRHPDLEPQRISSFVQNTDVTATVLEYLGIKDEAQEQMHSRSLLPLLSGEKSKVRDFSIAGYHNHSWCIYTEDWSYIHWLNEGEFKDNPLATLEFYGDLIKQMIPGIYQEGLKITGEDKIWSCTPGAKAEIPANDELYDRKNDPFQLKNIINDHKKTAKDLWIELRDYMLTLKVS